MAAILAGILFLFTFYAAEPLGLPEQAFLPLGVVIFLLLIPALLGMRSAQGGSDGAVGKTGLVIAVIGLAILTILFIIGGFTELVLGRNVEDLPGWVEAFLPIGFLGSIIGLAIFGIGAIMAKVLPRWGAVLFTIGLPVGAVIDIATGAFFEENGDTPQVGFFVGPPLFLIGLLWLGWTLWSGRTAAGSKEPGPAP
jgi:hypothetical protein